MALSDRTSGVVYVCLGETDEWHPFCPFATRDHAEMEEHEKIPGHWCEIDTGGIARSGLWAQVLAAKDARALDGGQA